MAKFNQNELNDEELDSVNGGLAYTNMVDAQNIYFGTSEGAYYNYSVAQSDFADFQKWASQYLTKGMTAEEIDNVIFGILSNPKDPRYPTEFAVTKLENALHK